MWVTNTRTDHVIAGIAVGRGADQVAVSPNGTHIYVADFQYSGSCACHRCRRIVRAPGRGSRGRRSCRVRSPAR